MEAKFHALPPLKRFRLLHQEKQQQDQQLETVLPAKKRKQCRETSKSKSMSSEFTAPITPPATFCLPAKKRVWAIRPKFSPTKSPLPSSTSFDLNAEYPPSPQKLETETNNTQYESRLNLLDSGAKKADFDEASEKIAEDEILDEERETEKQTPNPDELTQNDEEEDDGMVKKIDFERPTKQILKDGILREVERETEQEKQNPDGITQNEEEQEEEDDGILCAVCESTDGDPSDPIVFCDRCDLMVHASCYGNPLVKGIPEGDWFCAQCSVSKSSVSPEKCCLCPVSAGAMKPTTDGRWAHITCAVLVPEVFFEDPEGREGINCDMIPKKRWKEVCYVCEGRKGCVVDCSEPKCRLAFHVSCGLKEELCIELKEGKYSGGIVAAFCKGHTELWKKQQQTGKFRIVAREDHKH